MDITIIRNLMKEECGKPANGFSPSFFEEHIEVVARNAVKLAERLGANREVVELAAYLHDVAAVRDFSVLARHAELGAEQAGQILAGYGCPAETIAAVQQAAASHSVPIAMGGGTLEQICVSNADAISQIVRPVYWCHYVFGVRKFPFLEGRQWLHDRISSHWDALIPAARELCQEEYLFAKRLYE